MADENDIDPEGDKPASHSGTPKGTITRGADGKLYLTVAGSAARLITGEEAAAIEAVLHAAQVAITTIVHKKMRMPMKDSGHCVSLSGIP